MNILLKKAFTLVELIVTITILAILGTIAFLSFQSYSSDARDSVRISDISKIKTGFELFIIGNGKYPLPTNSSNITYSGGLVWIQGTYGDLTNTNVKSINKLPADPLTYKEYTYSVTPSRNEYQIAGILERGENAFSSEFSVAKLANASDNIAIALVDGNYNGQVVKSMSGSSICSVLGLPSIISSDSSITDLEQIIVNKKLVYSGYNNLPSSFVGTKFNVDGGFDYSPSSILMYSDNVGCSDLGNSELARVKLLKNLQDNIKGTILSNNLDYSEILGINVDEINPDNQSKIISRALVGTELGIKLESDSFIALSCDAGVTGGYSYPAIFHGAIENVSKSSNIDNGSILYGAQALCNDGEISIINEISNITCNNGFVESGLTCIEDLCSGSIPLNANSNATSQSVSNSWGYNETPGVCTFVCNNNYTYDSGSNSCNVNNQTADCGGSLPNNSTATTSSTYSQTWDGSVWTPVYNWGENQAFCDFDCNTNYTWNGESCVGNQFTVTFDGNGGSGYTPTSKSVEYNTAIGTLPSDPSKTGYTFNGWFTATSGGSQVTSATLVLGNVTVYAQWSVNSYTVTFDANGGNTPSPTTKSVTYNTAIGTLATTTRTGYTFTGWFTASTGGSQVTTDTLVSGNVTIYAQWTAINYTVTFNGNLGTGHTPTTMSVAYGSALGTLPTNPTRTGYTFNGWFTATSGGSQVTTSTLVTGNVTVYAQWTMVPGTMTLVYTGLVNGDVIQLPFKGTVNIVSINWGDDGVNGCATTATSTVSCRYTNASKGNYTIQVSGLTTGFGYAGTISGITKLTQITQWQGMGLTDLSRAFFGATNLVYLDPNLDTSNVTNMEGMFLSASKFNQSISNFDTSNVTNMRSMFQSASLFNQSLSSFNTSNVENMGGMFYSASSFNQPLSNFNTSNVTYMVSMFAYASAFNQPLSSFNTSKVTNMSSMFSNATLFNQPLSSFNTSNVTNMYWMFYNASAFNQSLSSFNTSNVTNMGSMFQGASSFNQSLSNFDTSNVTNMTSMFRGATVFNQSLSNFNTSNVTNMSRMFSSATNFNQPLSNFNTSNVTNMGAMFQGASKFNQLLSNFNTSNVTDMSYMFRGATSFDLSLSSFNTSKVTNMAGMFGFTKFNQLLNNFDTSNVTDMSSMFCYSTFNQPLSSFNTSKVTNMSTMFWGASAFNQSLSNFNTSNVISMNSLFREASSFNQSLSNFDTSNVTNMNQMFHNATSFNQPLNFNTSKVTDMSYMFCYAQAFNQSLSNFNTSNVTNINFMFYSATNFNKNISCWNVSLIASEPSSFATSSALISANKPLWGTNGAGGTCN